MEEGQNVTGPVKFTIVDRMEELPKETIPVKYKIEAAFVAIYVIFFVCILVKCKIPDQWFPLFEKGLKWSLSFMIFASSLGFIFCLLYSIREIERGKKLALWAVFSVLVSGLLYALNFLPSCELLFRGF